MTRFVVIRVRPFGDRNASRIGVTSGSCLLSVIGLCSIIRRLRSVSSPWLGPYLVVSLVGWAVGIKLQPDSPILYCQDLRKIPHPSGLVPWTDITLPDVLPAPPLSGASMVCCSTHNSGFSVTEPPGDRTLLSAGAGVHAPGAPESMLSNPEGPVVDVSSGNRDSVDTFLMHEVLLADVTSSLHPFFVHRLDVGPIRFTSIAHAFNYCVAVLRDGWSLPKGGWTHSTGCSSSLGTPGCGHVSDCVCAGFGGTIGSTGS